MPTLAELNAAHLFNQAVQNNTLPQLVDRALTGSDTPELKKALEKILVRNPTSHQILSLHPRIFDFPHLVHPSPNHPDIWKHPKIVDKMIWEEEDRCQKSGGSINSNKYLYDFCQHTDIWNHPNLIREIFTKKIKPHPDSYFSRGYTVDLLRTYGYKVDPGIIFGFSRNPHIFKQESFLNWLLKTGTVGLGQNPNIFQHPVILEHISNSPAGRKSLFFNPDKHKYPDFYQKMKKEHPKEKYSENDIREISYDSNHNIHENELNELVASIKPIPEERPLPSIPALSPTAEVDGNRPFTYQELLDITQLQAQKIYDLRQHRDNLYQENQHLRGTVDPSSYYNNVAEMGSPPTPTFEHPELAGVSSLTGRSELNAAPVFPNSSNILEFPTVPTPVRHQEMDGVPVPRQGYTELPQQAFSRSPVQRPRKKPLFGGRLARFGI